MQTSTGGTLSDNGDGSFDLALDGHHGGTAYFSDRPERVFGVSPTDRFLDGLGFPPDNPPNAALLVNAGDGEDVAIVELFDPAFDEATGRLAYRVKILAGYDEAGLQYVAQQVQDDELPAAFDQASLFIDDCAGYRLCCKELGGASGRAGRVGECFGLPPNAPSSDQCWDWFSFCGASYDQQQNLLDQACVAAYGDGYYAIP